MACQNTAIEYPNGYVSNPNYYDEMMSSEGCRKVISMSAHGYNIVL